MTKSNERKIKKLKKYIFVVTFMYDGSGEEYSTEEIVAKTEKIANKKADKMAKEFSIDETGEDEDYIVVYSVERKYR